MNDHDNASPIDLLWVSGLTIENGGLFRSRGQGLHPERVIQSWELIFVVRGVLSIQEGETPYEVKAHQALILSPGQRHFGTRPYPPDLIFYWFHFHLCPPPARTKAQRCALPKYSNVRQPERLKEYFQRLLNDQEEGTLSPLQGQILLALMLLELTRPAPPSQASAAGYLVAQAHQHLRVHFAQPDLSTSRIAAHLHCNPDYLGRLYAKHYGTTLTEAIHHQRLHEAARLLRESRENINEIAQRCGWVDVGHFRRLFRRKYGITPREYRRITAQCHVITL